MLNRAALAALRTTPIALGGARAITRVEGPDAVGKPRLALPLSPPIKPHGALSFDPTRAHPPQSCCKTC